MNAFFQQYGYLMVTMVIQAMLALSLYIPLMAGQLSLASAGFYSIGGYVAALFSTQVVHTSGDALYPLPYIGIEILLAALLCAVVAVIIGIIVLRLRGIFLALATVAFVEIIQVSALAFSDITQGADGIVRIPQPVSTQFGYMLIVVPLLIVFGLFTYRLERVRVGRAFVAIREDELVASSVGINPTIYKTLAFTLGAIMAGVAGAISAHLNNTWNPSFGSFDEGVLILAYVLVGGSRLYLGPILGGMVLTALPEVLRAVAGIQGLSAQLSKFVADSRLIIFGLLIALGTIFFPQGLITPTTFRRKRTLSGQPPADGTTPLKDVADA